MGDLEIEILTACRSCIEEMNVETVSIIVFQSVCECLYGTYGLGYTVIRAKRNIE